MLCDVIQPCVTFLTKLLQQSDNCVCIQVNMDALHTLQCNIPKLFTCFYYNRGKNEIT